MARTGTATEKSICAVGVSEAAAINVRIHHSSYELILPTHQKIAIRPVDFEYCNATTPSFFTKNRSDRRDVYHFWSLLLRPHPNGNLL